MNADQYAELERLAARFREHAELDARIALSRQERAAVLAAVTDLDELARLLHPIVVSPPWRRDSVTRDIRCQWCRGVQHPMGGWVHFDGCPVVDIAKLIGPAKGVTA